MSRSCWRGFLTLATLSAWPDLIVGLGIAVLNIDAAREVFATARKERAEAAPEPRICPAFGGKAPSLHKRHDDSRTGQPDTEPDNGQEQEPVLVKDPAVEEVVVAVHLD